MLNDWQPTASLNTLKQRAQLLQNIRSFFSQRQVLEVTTPLLSQHTVTDPHIESFVCTDAPHQTARYRYLQTSPEYAMKRLLASGSGPIYQITPAFRHEGSGRYHNPEFTLLEWYQPGFTHQDLMDEVDTLLQTCLKTTAATRLTYQHLFQRFLSFDPLTVSLDELKQQAQGIDVVLPNYAEDKTTWLQLLLTHRIEPQFEPGQVLFIHDFPAEQAALARINSTDPRTAARFEVYVGSLELANGFYELDDTMEQEKRFLTDKKQRNALGLPDIEIDHRLLQALAHGFPPCSGIAMGFDRLVMLATKCDRIEDVIAFPFERS